MTSIYAPSYTHGVVHRDRLIALRKARGWTQEDLAKAAGVSQGTISRLERGEIRAAWSDTLPKIAEVLGTSVEYLKGAADAAAPEAVPAAELVVPSGSTGEPLDAIPETLGGMRGYAEQEKRARKQLARDGDDVPEWVWPHVRASNALSVANVAPSVAMLCELAKLIAMHADPNAKPPVR